MKNTLTFKTKATRGIKNAERLAVKHSPLALTITGVIGLGATAYLAYKSAHKIEDITDDLDERRQTSERMDDIIDEIEASKDMDPNDVDIDHLKDIRDELKDLESDFKPIDRRETVYRLAKAVAAPVATGVLSVTAIALSYYIQNNRILNLAASLATATAENAFFEKKYRDTYGDKKYEEFVTPTKEEEVEKDGKSKKVKVQAKKDGNGRWFSESNEYASDDHDYNRQFIRTVEERMQNKLFRNGYLVLNDVLDQLGFERSRAGALAGWSIEDDFKLSQIVTNITDPVTGEMNPQIYVSWTKPRYIYDDVSYTGRYSE